MSTQHVFSRTFKGREQRALQQGSSLAPHSATATEPSADISLAAWHHQGGCKAGSARAWHRECRPHRCLLSHQATSPASSNNSKAGVPIRKAATSKSSGSSSRTAKGLLLPLHGTGESGQGSALCWLRRRRTCDVWTVIPEAVAYALAILADVAHSYLVKPTRPARSFHCTC